jgi:hypothetical protein
MYAFAPDGTPITGTLERLSGEALVDPESFSRKEDGTLVYDHAGETVVFWDGQETEKRGGKVVFVDDGGDEWTEDQIVLSEDENWLPGEAETAELDNAPQDKSTPAEAALKRIASRLRGEWHEPTGDLESDIASVLRTVPGLA